MIKTEDELNKAIIKILSAGNKSFASIAEELGVTENTIRSRVNRLTEDKILNIAGYVDVSKMDNIQLAYMGVKSKTLDLELVASKVMKLEGVINCAIVTGKYDLLLTIQLDSTEKMSLLDFFKNKLNNIEEISEVETFIVYHSYDLMIPYKF